MPGWAEAGRLLVALPIRPVRVQSFRDVVDCLLLGLAHFLIMLPVSGCDFVGQRVTMKLRYSSTSSDVALLSSSATNRASVAVRGP